MNILNEKPCIDTEKAYLLGEEYLNTNLCNARFILANICVYVDSKDRGYYHLMPVEDIQYFSYNAPVPTIKLTPLPPVYAKVFETMLNDNKFFENYGFHLVYTDMTHKETNIYFNIYDSENKVFYKIDFDSKFNINLNTKSQLANKPQNSLATAYCITIGADGTVSEQLQVLHKGGENND